MEPTKPTPELFAAIDAAYERLFDSLDSLDADGFGEPSLLPGWTRAHVVAHLNDNANGFARALEGLALGRLTPVYASSEARDQTIDEQSQHSGPELLAESGSSQKRWRSVVRGLDAKVWGSELERTPGGVRFPVAVVPLLREREIEMHHVDLDVDYAPEDWPRAFVDRLVEDLVWDMGEKADVTLVATDTGARYDLGAGGQEVRGSAARLAWWLARQDPTGIESAGELPELGEWVRRPR
ncbi:maleylpyruvate isomerase family mycothiol-dependent enzyme [Mariniluteicoccus endophyticus]